MLKKTLFLFVAFLSMSCHSVLFGQDTIRVLAIGNSFSVDAIENNLYDLGEADNVTFIIGGMYIGGASLERHWSNALSDAAAYSYRKIDATGKKNVMENTRLSQAIVDEEWDYITFQQVSQNSGQYDTYFPYLTNLLDYVKSRVTNRNVTYAMHMTWAYAQSATHSGFVNYNKDQLTMYNAIVDAVVRAGETVDISTIIPAGTAIQNARTSFIGDNLCRDGYHLDEGIGRYIAACTWYTKLTGRSVVENTFAPKGLPSRNIALAQKAADYAVNNPFEVTDMSSELTLPDPNTFDLKSEVNIDFGSSFSANPWNNVSSFSAGTSVKGLMDMNGESTPFNIEIIDAFGGINRNGPANGLTLSDWTISKEATSDSFFGNAGAPFSGRVVEIGSFQITGLNPSKEYIFSMFTSRSASDNRETSFTIGGVMSETIYVNSASNTTQLGVIDGIKPKMNGTVKLTVGAGPNNNNTNNFFYINALQIRQQTDENAIDEDVVNRSFYLYPNPSSQTINIVGLNDTEYDYVIASLDGKIVRKGFLQASENKIDVTSLHNSCYVVQLRGLDLSQTIPLYFIKK